MRHETNTFTELIIHFPQNFDDKELIGSDLMENYDCDGMQDYALEEKELDALLGKEAVTGGPLSQDILQLIENHASNNDKPKGIYYFTGENSLSKAEIARKNILENHPSITNIELIEKPQENWNEEWKKYFKPIQISEDFAIYPSWIEVSPLDLAAKKNILKIDPGQAFGTGNHESTKLCLQLIAKHSKNINPSSIMDFGCGSGILALSLLKILKNKNISAHFYDIDEAAMENVHHNIELNKNLGLEILSENCTFAYGSPFPSKNHFEVFDFVCANILLPILIEQSHTLYSILKPKGYLLISGIMIDQWEELFQVLSKNTFWNIIDQKSENNWLGILIQKQ